MRLEYADKVQPIDRHHVRVAQRLQALYEDDQLTLSGRGGTAVI